MGIYDDYAIDDLTEENEQIKKERNALRTERDKYKEDAERRIKLVDKVGTEAGLLEKENIRLRAALEQIRDQDYRGNRCSCSQLAFKVLNKKD